MKRAEIENVLRHINEKQEFIDRREKRLDKIYATDPFDEKRADRIEEDLSREYAFRNGMVWALCCALGGNATVEQKPGENNKWSIKFY